MPTSMIQRFMSLVLCTVTLTQCQPCNDDIIFGAANIVNKNSLCVFHTHSAGAKPLRSHVTVHDTPSVPNSQSYAHIANAILDKDRIYLYSNCSTQPIDVSWSQWGEFFHISHLDRISVTTIDQIDIDVFVTQPTFYLPILTFHVGHLLIDTIEQIYTTMISHYGAVRTDTLLILDVADGKEREVLQEKIRVLLYDKRYYTYGVMLRWFTDIPILSALTLQQSQLRILFSDMHIGLDIEHTYFNQGYRYHPHPFRFTDRSIKLLAARYQRFRDYVQSKCNPIVDASSPSALFIRRNNTRAILNTKELLAIGVDVQVPFVDIDLDVVKFSSQLRLLYNANLLVATAGTALHNMLFMRPGSSVIILMQPEWCDWAWQYANQAVLLDIRATVICGKEVQQKYFSWTKNFWRQGPRMTKLENFTVDADSFRNVLKDFVLRRQNSSILNIVDYIYESHVDNILELSPPIRVVLTTASATPISDESGLSWEVKLMGELVSSSLLDETIYQAMPYLTICVQIMRTNSLPLCCRLNSLMYFGSYIARTDTPVMWLHYWAKISPDGMKIRYSDGYSVIDIRESFPVHSRSVVPFTRTLLLVDNKHQQAATFTDGANDRHSFTHGISRLCRDNNLQPAVCIDYVPKLTNYARKMTLIRDLKMPSVQFTLSSKQPFLLLVTDPAVDILYKEYAAIIINQLLITLFRLMLAVASQNKLKHMVLCADNSPCNRDGAPIHLDTTSNAVIFAGNFYLQSDISCAMIIIHPLQRLVFLYYRHCFDDPNCVGYQRRLGDLTQVEVVSLHHIFTMNNICFVLSNHTSCDNHRAVATANSCVVAAIEDVSSLKQIFSFWFPWMSEIESAHDTLHREYNAAVNEFEPFHALNPHTKIYLLELLESDIRLYEHIVSRMNHMLSVVDNRGFYEL